MLTMSSRQMPYNYQISAKNTQLGHSIMASTSSPEDRELLRTKLQSLINRIKADKNLVYRESHSKFFKKNCPDPKEDLESYKLWLEAQQIFRENIRAFCQQNDLG